VLLLRLTPKTHPRNPPPPQAGIHSGDSACSLPTQSIPEETLKTIRKWTFEVAEALGVVGLINIQYAIQVRLQTRLTSNSASAAAVSCGDQPAGHSSTRSSFSKRFNRLQPPTNRQPTANQPLTNR
jgi:hypothetical protein